MLPGNVPSFRPGIHNPARALNELAAQAGQALGLQVAPPLCLDHTPAGMLLRLQEEAEAAAEDLPDPFDRVSLNSPSVNVPYTGEQIEAGTFEIEEPGLYQVTGQVWAKAERSSPPGGSTPDVMAWRAGITNDNGSVFAESANWFYWDPSEEGVLWPFGPLHFYVRVTANPAAVRVVIERGFPTGSNPSTTITYMPFGFVNILRLR